MIRIVMVDDHALVRAGLRMILEKQADIEVVGEADDGEAGLQLIRNLQPDLALVDLHMPNVNGIEVTERVRRSKLVTRIVILTMASDAPFPRRLLEAGASGYLTKGCPADELVRAIRQISDGRRYLSTDVAQQLALGNAFGDGESPFEELSTRELEVAMMLAQGMAAKQIGDRLKLSEKTVATYKYRLFEKLAIDNVVTLTHLATAHGLMDKPRRGVAG
ncbi:response regulator [Rudaea cellulosilytica]|uniref:response regulator n=1 Tax=Rudaea cellulosilytica TaxID=540746 RepID=UPI00035D0331|nr:response regulator [Rudaea cellulosilytica]